MTSSDLQPLSPDDWAHLEDNLRSEYPILLQVAKNFLGRSFTDDDYEDVTQIAVTKLWQSAPRHSPEKDPNRIPLHRYFASAYAHTTVINEAINAIRAAQRRLKHVVPTTQDLDAVAAIREPDHLEEMEQLQGLEAAASHALSGLQLRDSAIVRASQADPYASPEQMRTKAEDLLGAPILPCVFATAKSRAIARFQKAVDRAVARAKSDSKSHS